MINIIGIADDFVDINKRRSAGMENDYWSYPLEEIDYLIETHFEECMDNKNYMLYNNRLWEVD